MKRRCPICGKEADSETNADFPFCSERCHLLDLGNWASEKYRISSPTFDESQFENIDPNRPSKNLTKKRATTNDYAFRTGCLPILIPTPRHRPLPPKHRIALFLSTVCGLGYMPFAPGTFGALSGVGIYWAIVHLWLHDSFTTAFLYSFQASPEMVGEPWELLCFLNLFVAWIGLASAEIVSTKTGIKDPQFIVIDETSGQMLAYSLAFAPLNWKYLLLGFILFRLFDIWKPFPARQAESLPGGWGIMTDDWVAGIYAALGLWIARAAGL